MSVLQIGYKISDYKIVELLGENPFGASYLAQQTLYDPQTGQPTTTNFAVKTINLAKVTELGKSPNVMIQEVDALKKMSGKPSSSKYIAGYYESQVINEQGQQFLIIVTDYIAGTSLQQILLDQVSKKVPFDKNVLLQMMYEISGAVSFIHTNGIAHQNIKPSNIIKDDTGRLRLVDFAYSCSYELNAECKGKAGTTYYMPPETITADPATKSFAYRAAHDVWSIGVVFYQLANLGKDYITFTSADPEIIAKDIQINPVNPSEYSYAPVNGIINTMLQKNVSSRPTAGQVLILVKEAMPMCVIDDDKYSVNEASAILTTMGIPHPDNINGYELCKVLTDNLVYCQLKNKRYRKSELLKLANLLGINVSKEIESTKLCKELGKMVKQHHARLSKHVTTELLNTLEVLAELKTRPTRLPQIIMNLEAQYLAAVDTAMDLELVNTKQLDAVRQEALMKHAVYQQNVSADYAQAYAIYANEIVELIKRINPQFRST